MLFWLYFNYKIMKQQHILEQIHKRILARLESDSADGSYVKYLQDKGIDAILKKVGEESSEFIMAAKDYQYADDASLAAKRKMLVHELCDLWFHSLVALGYNAIDFEEVTEEMAQRFEKDDHLQKTLTKK